MTKASRDECLRQGSFPHILGTGCEVDDGVIEFDSSFQILEGHHWATRIEHIVSYDNCSKNEEPNAGVEKLDIGMGTCRSSAGRTIPSVEGQSSFSPPLAGPTSRQLCTAHGRRQALERRTQRCISSLPRGGYGRRPDLLGGWRSTACTFDLAGCPSSCTSSSFSTSPSTDTEPVPLTSYGVGETCNEPSTVRQAPTPHQGWQLAGATWRKAFDMWDGGSNAAREIGMNVATVAEGSEDLSRLGHVMIRRVIEKSVPGAVKPRAPKYHIANWVFPRGPERAIVAPSKALRQRKYCVGRAKEVDVVGRTGFTILALQRPQLHTNRQCPTQAFAIEVIDHRERRARRRENRRDDPPSVPCQTARRTSPFWELLSRLVLTSQTAAAVLMIRAETHQ
ncbi:hypothetical protein C8R47DRAFT_1071655 [Mycena vitilis]|nr:hypothetical protein C8R47DRAFT_1071655 [Mycena vitilis]